MIFAVNLGTGESAGWFTDLAQRMNATVVADLDALGGKLLEADADSGSASVKLILAHAPSTREEVVSIRERVAKTAADRHTRVPVVFVSSAPDEFPLRFPGESLWQNCHFLRRLPVQFAGSGDCRSFVSNLEAGIFDDALLDVFAFPRTMLLAFLTPPEGLSQDAAALANYETGIWEERLAEMSFTQYSRSGSMSIGDRIEVLCRLLQDLK